MSERTEIIMRSAELRLENALEAFRRAAFGDEEYHREAKHVRVLDAQAFYDEPPTEPPKLSGVRRHYLARRFKGR